MQRGSFGQTSNSSFALSPSKVILCSLVCTAFESPVLSKVKQATLYNYVLAQLSVSSFLILHYSEKMESMKKCFRQSGTI